MGELFATFGIDWRLLLIQAINFGVLLAALTYFLYRPVMRMIEARQEKIAEGVKQAEEAAEHLASAEEEKREIVTRATKEADEVLSSARTRAEEKSGEIVTRAREQADQLVGEAKMRAEEAKRQAIKESEKEITRAALLAAEKILREKTH